MTIRVPSWFQGPTGFGQGGWTAHQFVETIGQPATVAIRSPIPLDTDMAISERADGWVLAPVESPDHIVLHATRWEPSFPDTDPISLAVAAEAATRFPLKGEQHPVPVCFSCGLESDSMKIHSGSLGDGRWATDWTVPPWAVNPDRSVNEGAMWAAIDCAAAWYVGCEGGIRQGVTVQLAVEVLEPLVPDETYAIVAWRGDFAPDWDGRKRGAASQAFAADGRCVARSTSFWLAVED